jgi:hypothetical protein
MNHSLYTFLGCITALDFTVQHSSAPDKASALAACADLTATGQAILTQLGANASEEAFRDFFGTQVTIVLEAIETLKQSSVFSEIHPTLLAVLDYYYAAADGLMGGGGWPASGWPISISSVGAI